MTAEQFQQLIEMINFQNDCLKYILGILVFFTMIAITKAIFKFFKIFF